MAISAWDACGKAPSLASAIASCDWTALSQEVVESLLWLFGAGLDLDDQDGLDTAEWVARNAGAIEDALRESDGRRRQGKLLYELHWLVGAWPADVLWQTGDAAVRLASRLAAAPFKPDARPVWVWSSLLEHAPPSQIERLAELPDRVWRILDGGCRRRNQADQIAAGFEDLARTLGPSIVDYLVEAPRQLLRMARSAGLLSDASRAALLSRWSHDHRQDGPREALDRLHEVIAATVLAPVGGEPNRSGDDALMHAALLRRSIQPNRRALGAFLRRYLGGDERYLETHPLTRRWLAQHPSIKVDRLEALPPLATDVPDWGTVTLALETNPLEVLRLGTYVGSCLSLGGAFGYSAAAVALDVNKHVVYVRSRRGSVLARQLLAISEQEQLVRFAVYPASAPEDVRRHLMAFSELVAEELGIGVHRPEEDEPCDIALVVANEWWDDGAA